jgi:hypothetical protein
MAGAIVLSAMIVSVLAIPLVLTMAVKIVPVMPVIDVWVASGRPVGVGIVDRGVRWASSIVAGRVGGGASIVAGMIRGASCEVAVASTKGTG